VENISIVIEAINKASKDLNAVTGDLEKLKGELAGVGSSFSDFNSKLSKVGGQFRSIGTALTVGFSVPATLALKEVINSAVEFEDSLANVRKTTGATEKQLKSIGDELRKMSENTRTSAEELVGIATIGGQMGVAAEDVVSFTDAVDKANVALGDEFSGGAEEIATQLGTLRGLFSDIKTDNVSDDLLSVGNALNVLGSEGLATADYVTEASKRIAGISIPLGQTSGQVLGLSATMQELGVNVERGSTAVGNVLQTMATNTEDFAKVAGVSTQEFANLVNTDINGAFLTVLDGINELNPSTTELATLLDELGLDGRGTSELFLKMAQNTDLLREKQDLASNSLLNTDSILSEFNIKNSTTAAELGKLRNTFKNLSIEVGSVVLPALRELVEQIKPVIESITETARKNPELVKTILTIAGVAAAIGPILLILGGLTAAITTLATPVGLVVGAFTLLAGAAAVLAVKASQNQELFIKLAGIYNSYVKPIVEALGDVFTGVLVPAFDAVKSVVTAVIPFFQEVLPQAFNVLGYIISSLASILTGLLGPAFRFISALLTPLINLLGPILGPIIGQVIEEVRLFAAQLFGPLQFAVKIIGQALDGLALILQKVADFFGLAGDEAEKVSKRVGDSTNELANGVEGLSTITQEQADATINALGNIITAGTEVSESFATSLEESGISVETLAEKVEDGSLTIEDAVSQVTKAVEDNKDTFGESSEEIQKGVEEVTGVLQDYNKTVSKDGVKAADKLIDSNGQVVDSLAQVDASAFQTSDALNTAATEGFENFGQTGVEAIDELIAGTQEGQAQIAGATSEIGEAAVQGVEGLPQEFDRLAAEAIAGFVNGIKNRIGQVSSATAQMAQAATTAAKSNLKIQSPSKVFEEMGINTTAGFVVGLEKGTPEVLDAINRLSKGTIEEQEELIGQLEDALGFFGGAGITRGGEVVETFTSISDAIETTREVIGELEEDSQAFVENANSLYADVFSELFTSLEIPQDTVDSYDELEEGLEQIRQTLEDAVEKHNEFVQEAKDGLDEYAAKVEEVNKKFDEMLGKATEEAGNQIGDAVVESLERRKELEQEIADIKTSIFEKELELAKIESEGGDVAKAKEELDIEKEKLSTLEAQKVTTQGLIDQFEQLKSNAGSLTEQLKANAEATKEAQEKLKELQEGGKASAEKLAEQQAKINALKQEELILFGKQILAQNSIDEANAKIQDAQERANLSEIDYIALQLAREKKAIEEKRQAELAAMEEIRKVQEAIAQGRVSELDPNSFETVAASDLAQKALLEEQTFKATLQSQLAAINEYKTEELNIYTTQKDELEAQQLEYEELVNASYDRIIVKLQELAQKAREASLAQSKVKGGGFSEGGFTGFDKGGFTGFGNLKDVAGLVHKGEWVAPNWMVKAFAPMFNQLEGMRRNRIKGFEEGGWTSGAMPTTYNQPITINANTSNNIDFDVISQYLKFQMRGL